MLPKSGTCGSRRRWRSVSRSGNPRSLLCARCARSNHGLWINIAISVEEIETRIRHRRLGKHNGSIKIRPVQPAAINIPIKVDCASSSCLRSISSRVCTQRGVHCYVCVRVSVWDRERKKLTRCLVRPPPILILLLVVSFLSSSIVIMFRGTLRVRYTTRLHQDQIDFKLFCMYVKTNRSIYEFLTHPSSLFVHLRLFSSLKRFILFRFSTRFVFLYGISNIRNWDSIRWNTMLSHF